MKNYDAIMAILTQYLKDNPSIRFGQALFNLNITKFQNNINPERCNNLLRDIYNDTDEQILKRMSP